MLFTRGYFFAKYIKHETPNSQVKCRLQDRLFKCYTFYFHKQLLNLCRKRKFHKNLITDNGYGKQVIGRRPRARFQSLARFPIKLKDVVKFVVNSWLQAPLELYITTLLYLQLSKYSVFAGKFNRGDLLPQDNVDHCVYQNFLRAPVLKVQIGL